MTPKKVILLSLALCGCLITIGLLAQQAPTEAPAGFDTPTLQTQNAGSESSSNGIAEPPGDSFVRDQQIFEKREDAALGLGPVFNATACVECHQNPVSGGPSQITELRVGHKDDNGNFVNPTITINGGGTISGRSLINDRAICPQVQERVPDSEDIRTLRAVLNTLGDGFVEAVDDSTLTNIANNQPSLSEGRIQGEAIQVPILEAPGNTRIGRFGWKDQHGSLLSFTADAYLNEMGITSRLKPIDMTDVCKVKADLEDTPDELEENGHLRPLEQRRTSRGNRESHFLGRPPRSAQGLLILACSADCWHQRTTLSVAGLGLPFRPRAGRRRTVLNGLIRGS